MDIRPRGPWEGIRLGDLVGLLRAQHYVNASSLRPSTSSETPSLLRLDETQRLLREDASRYTVTHKIKGAP